MQSTHVYHVRFPAIILLSTMSETFNPSRPNFKMEFYLALPHTFFERNHINTALLIPVLSFLTHELIELGPAMDAVIQFYLDTHLCYTGL